MKNLFNTLIVILLIFSSPALLAIPESGSHMMIAAPSKYAVEVGQKVAAKGGNVVDVAVAVGLTLAVTSPYYASLGGGGFAMIKVGKDVEVLDFREMAPIGTHPKYYLDKPKDASINGGHAVGVPGVPAGLWAMHKKYGKLKWSELYREPLLLAQKGFRVSGEWVQKTNSNETRFNDFGRKHFFNKKGKPYRPGETLRQPGLADALKQMRHRNILSFYSGPIAQDMVEAVKQSGGVLSLKDLKNYKVRWLKPLKADFQGYEVYLMPPPSSGGIVIQSALELVKRVDVTKQKPLSVNELHLLGEILSRSFRGRSLLGDPDFHQNPLEFLVSDAYLNKMAKSIDLDKTESIKPLADGEWKESDETTHFSVLDAKGHAVSLTVTLNGSYGSGLVSPRFGIALNNEMDDFTTRPDEPNMYGLVQGKGNVVEPGKRPLSSMSPSFVVKNNQVKLAIGAPGGPRIISGVFQAIYRVLVSGFNLDWAIQAPRVHHQFLPHKLFVDTYRFAPETIDGLKKKGHEVEESWNSRVYGVLLNDSGILDAAFDSRGEGAAGGY
ncbi:MAG: gamma-glutamyltransferase [Pseudobdellovibrionaceae bacterium]|nr:gamma-glutamyltransferase [Bdellovibrionales bacterium]USN47167.1 MAG: gamma-glutamyltransferase [Pseudobdellovibrionaceae bacterium]